LSSFSDIEIKELYDNKAVLMLFGALMNNPTTLLKHDRYRLEVSDFVARHHKIIFSAINNLVNSGVDKLDSISIDSYLNKYPEQYKIFSDNRGLEALEFARNTAKGDNFVYYYNRVKKFSLLRAYLKSGIDIRFIYDPDEINTGKKEKMQTNLDSLTINEIIELVDMKIVDIRQSFELSADSYGQRAGQDIKELIDDLLEAPAIGLPLNGKFINSIVRGARLKKLYMRSAPTGVGKTRFSAGDSINLAVATIWDSEENKWVENGVSVPTLFITTELEIQEIQTLFLAFISDVNEAHILDGEYEEGEKERVIKAAEIMQATPIWIEHLSNHNIQQVENIITKHKLKNGVEYVFFDYVHTTLKILAEISAASRGVRLREDNVLLMFVSRLKKIANELGVFIYTATQVNGDWDKVDQATQNLLRGIKVPLQFLSA
jgi:replicative DNA helicase